MCITPPFHAAGERRGETSKTKQEIRTDKETDPVIAHRVRRDALCRELFHCHVVVLTRPRGGMLRIRRGVGTNAPLATRRERE